MGSAHFGDDADVRCRLSFPLAHAQTTTSLNDSSLVSARITIRSTSAAPPLEEILRFDSVALQCFDRCSQQILALACLLVGVGTTALSINGFDDQPAMRVPLIVATIAAWFTVALVFLSSLRVCSLKKHELARVRRMLMFSGGYLVLSGLAFVLAFLAPPWTSMECDAGCRAAGVMVERVLAFVVVAGGLCLTYLTVTGNVGETGYFV